jgi:hypothetical protein
MYTGSRLHIHVMKSHKSQPFVQNKVIHFSRNALYGTYYTLRDVSEMDPGSTVRESEMTFHQSDISSKRTRVRAPTGAKAASAYGCESPRVERRRVRAPIGGARLWVPASTGASADGCKTLRRRVQAPTGGVRLRVRASTGASADTGRSVSATAIAPPLTGRSATSSSAIAPPQRNTPIAAGGRLHTGRAPPLVQRLHGSERHHL